MSKVDEVRGFISRCLDQALDQRIARLVEANNTAAVTLRKESSEIRWTMEGIVTEEYRLLELYDIVEWKRQRVRR